ncbi:PAS domain-containing protein [Actimicrobium sp. CCC2.4]|uniref:PAS domain-containing protein n=1 Tax=Actimicrobium sp. CCC2.4 TaxID=3048606 RepID=UPI002AC9C9F0|nr:PAS domain-containing protein [Actimicrobium sp. CCC2.4]MEB0133996.1 PAS domain-containing protein [Actimicrobium sp. CCC2.4]WPX31532.1 PAS domain-containing protein [Actimicrobium sp. CCC2.4]
MNPSLSDLSGIDDSLTRELNQMQSDPATPLALRCRRIALGIALAVALTGAGVLLLWRLPLPHLMPANVALGLLLAGMTLALQSLPLIRRLPVRLLALGIAALVAALGLVTVAHGLSLGGTELDAFLAGLTLPLTGSPAMPIHPVSAFALALSGIALLLQDMRTRARHAPTEFMALSLVALNLVPLAGLAYQVPALADLGNPMPVPATAALAFFSLGAGMLLSQPSRSLMAIITDNVPGGQMLRRSLPQTLLVLVLLNWIISRGALLELYGQALVSPILTLLNSSVILVIFWRTAATVNDAYRARLQSASDLAQASSLLIAVSDNTDDPIFVKNRDGKLIFANPAMLRSIGKSREEALYRSSSELLPDPDEAAQVDRDDQHIMQGSVSVTLEQTLHLPQGERTYSSTKAPWFDPDGQLLGLIGISTDISTRKEMERQLKQREAELEATVSQRTAVLRKLGDHLESVREEEKRSIARELHDDMGASLTSLNMHLDSIYKALPDEPAWSDKATRVRALVASLVATTRRIQIGLRPIMLDLFGLKAGIIEQLEEFEQRTGITCKTSLPDDEVALPHKLEITLYRMLQEALNNVAKHAQATRVDVILDVDEDQAVLTVRDDGIGIPPERINNQSTYGIRGLSERASFLGGTASVFANPVRGTTVRIVLPAQL